MSYPNARRALAVALSGLLAAPLLQAADSATAAAAGSADNDATAGTEDVVLPTVVVTAQLLNEKRADISKLEARLRVSLRAFRTAARLSPRGPRLAIVSSARRIAS